MNPDKLIQDECHSHAAPGILDTSDVAFTFSLFAIDVLYS